MNGNSLNERIKRITFNEIRYCKNYHRLQTTSLVHKTSKQYCGKQPFRTLKYWNEQMQSNEWKNNWKKMPTHRKLFINIEKLFFFAPELPKLQHERCLWWHLFHFVNVYRNFGSNFSSFSVFSVKIFFANVELKRITTNQTPKTTQYWYQWQRLRLLSLNYLFHRLYAVFPCVMHLNCSYWTLSTIHNPPDPFIVCIQFSATKRREMIIFTVLSFLYCYYFLLLLSYFLRRFLFTRNSERWADILFAWNSIWKWRIIYTMLDFVFCSLTLLIL